MPNEATIVWVCASSAAQRLERQLMIYKKLLSAYSEIQVEVRPLKGNLHANYTYSISTLVKLISEYSKRIHYCDFLRFWAYPWFISMMILTVGGGSK